MKAAWSGPRHRLRAGGLSRAGAEHGWQGGAVRNIYGPPLGVV